MAKLTVKQISALNAPGFYGDGEGLYLKVGASEAKSWILRTVVHGRRRDLGIGSASLVSLAAARNKARELRQIARDGGDPDSIRKKESLTFAEAAQRVYDQLKPTWRNKKHSETWLASLQSYAFPIIGKRPIETITSADLLRVLGPIWTSKHETAKRLKQRISTIFDWAKGAGHFPNENPVNGLKKAMPTVKPKVEHMPAMDWRDLPAFMSELADREGVSARTLEFTILTAVRSGEARGARWSEISGNIWTIPGERMKRGIPHRVALSKEALAVIDKTRGLDVDLIFPSQVRRKDGATRPQSVMVFKALYKRMGRSGFTTHGFRSTFRDWCSEFAKVDFSVAEAALSHSTGNAVAQAYARSDLLERRIPLMAAWGRFVAGEDSNVLEVVFK